jgi:hypothetical protein
MFLDDSAGFDIIDSIPANMLRPKANPSQQPPVFVKSMSEEPTRTGFQPDHRQGFSPQAQQPMSMSPQPTYTHNTWQGVNHNVLKQSGSASPIINKSQKAMSEQGYPTNKYSYDRAEDNYQSNNKNVHLSYSLGYIHELDPDDSNYESEAPKQAETLKCPRCALSFTSEKHREYMKHISDCC